MSHVFFWINFIIYTRDYILISFFNTHDFSSERENKACHQLNHHPRPLHGTSLGKSTLSDHQKGGEPTFSPRKPNWWGAPLKLLKHWISKEKALPKRRLSKKHHNKRSEVLHKRVTLHKVSEITGETLREGRYKFRGSKEDGEPNSKRSGDKLRRFKEDVNKWLWIIN